MTLIDLQEKVPNQFIQEINGVSLFLKREDLLHPEVSGNKFRKLKYNLQYAWDQGYESLLTFGGAYSNHIAATAAAGKICHMKTIGLIRGEELGRDLEKTLQGNPSLRFAHSCGMKFEFLSRSEYRERNHPEFLKGIREKYKGCYLLPEGGTNSLAVQGCQEILQEADREYDIICAPVGTGGTLAGLINSSFDHQRVLGFPALKGEFLSGEVQRLSQKDNWELMTDYHFGGYAKLTEPLIKFINAFKRTHGIQLDPVYTGKMMYGIQDLLEKGSFSKNTRILAIHTGGLQGIEGMNERLKRKNQIQIDI